MRRLLLVLSLAFAAPLTSSCSYTKRVKFLSDTEFDHYYAMRAYMNDDRRKEFLKLKTEEERTQYLKEFMLPGLPPRSLWDTFYQYPTHIREKIIEGGVQKGWTVDMLMMSWGRPMKSRKLPGRQAERSLLFIYKFEAHPDGSVLVWQPDSKTVYKADRTFIREVILDDDVIAVIKDK
jgi:hypothetical protein